jgi:hypothetical protein
MTFISEKGRFRLPACSVFVPMESERGLVVAFSEPRGRPGPETLALCKALRLESFNPGRRQPGGDAAPRGSNRPLATTPSYPSPGDMPSGAAAYCAFDMVVLAGEGFGLLRAKQTDAILTWVRAGGSVLVLPTGGLKAHHARFLNALAGTDGDADAASPAYALTPGGRVEGEGDLRCFHAGLGRAVVGLEAPTGEDALRGTAWRRTAAFLWKVRRDQLDRIVRKGEWTAVKDEQHSHRRDGRLMFGRVPMGAGSTLENKLFPERIKVIPLWVIILILALFVAVIGPVDYFVLGLLRRRKLTWITFPAAAVGFALFTMLLAEVYMGSTDHRNSVTVVDLGARGRVLRTSRYEVIVAGRNRDSRTDVVGGFFAPVDPAALPGGGGSYGSRDRSMACYEGLLPARFTAMQQIYQWKPQMNRFLFIGAEAPPLERQGPSAPPRIELDWDDIQPVVPGTQGDAEKLREVREAVVGSAPGVAAGAAVFRAGKMRAQGNVVAGLALQTVHELCVRPRQGFFTVVSQVSPTGGGDFEDSALLDPTDPDQWLLAVVVRDGQNFTIYRRLYHEGAEARAP